MSRSPVWTRTKTSSTKDCRATIYTTGKLVSLDIGVLLPPSYRPPTVDRRAHVTSLSTMLASRPFIFRLSHCKSSVLNRLTLILGSRQDCGT